MTDQLILKKPTFRHRLINHDGMASLFKNPPLPWLLRIIFTIITLSVLVSVGWRASGGTLYTITSPSMCPEVCVGSLVLDRPLPPGQGVHIGETVTFLPSGFSSVYTHRVVKVFSNGSFETKGDAANVVDPWVVTTAEVRGVTQGTIWGLGWLSNALPFLAMGMLAIVIMRRYIHASVRREWDRLFAILIVLVPVWLIKPLIRGVVVISSHLHHGYGKLTIVNTGLLPAQFRAVQGQFKDFVSPGQRFSISGRLQSNGQVSVSEFASFHWVGWAVVILIVLSPLISFLLRQRHNKHIDYTHHDPSALPQEPEVASLASTNDLALHTEVSAPQSDTIGHPVVVDATTFPTPVDHDLNPALPVKSKKSKKCKKSKSKKHKSKKPKKSERLRSLDAIDVIAETESATVGASSSV